LVAPIALVALLGACKDSGTSKLEGKRPPQRAPVPAADGGAPVIRSELKLLGCAAAATPPASLAAQTRGGAPASPQVTLGPMTVTGLHGKADIAASLAKHMPRLQYCYQQRLVKQPSLGGALELSITIQPNGRVFEVIPANGFDEELTLCLKHIVSEIKFPDPVKKPPGNTTVKQSLTFSWQPAKLPQTPYEPKQWTPFAAVANASPAVADQAAATFPPSMTLSTLEACLGAHTGSFRSMIQISKSGTVGKVRTGGLGDKAAESCVSQKLHELKLQTPVTEDVEIACDFQRGDATPWRISLDAGYTVLEAASPPPAAAATDNEQTFVVVVDPKTTADQLTAALEAASRGVAAIVAIRADAGAPIYVAAGPHSAIAPDPSASIILDTGTAPTDPLTVCGGLMPDAKSGPLAQADVVLGAATRHCTHRPCPAQLIITTGGGHDALDLAALAGAARGVDLERVMLGTASCRK
jgi:hypothetical protein